MKIKEQTRKLSAGCSKQCFEVVDRTDEVSNHTYGKVKLTWFEEIFEEYKMILLLILYHKERD
ncbi:chlorohydrolase [Streptococcus mitis 17/34]|nr:chlorohydrolase [Streptococcus mitis 17/34]